MKIFLLFVLSVVCFTQRGRGGSSSSRSSSSSSSTRIYTTGHPVYTRTYVSRNSCVEQCHINYFANPQLLAGCLAICEQRQRRQMYGFLGFFGIICVACCGWACYQNMTRTNNVSVQSSQEGRPSRQQFIRKTKDRLHNVSTNYMSLDQFQMEKQMFEKQNWKMYYFHQNKQNFNDTVTFYFRAEEPFVYSFTCRGKDEVGSWGGNGYFLCTSTGIKLWMLKDYDDREAAQQINDYQLLMYEGQQISKQKYQGKWYFVGFEHNFEDSGKWAMVPKYALAPHNPYVADYY